MLYYNGLVKVLNFCITFMTIPLIMNVRSKDYKKKTVVWAILTVLYMILVMAEIIKYGTPEVLDCVALIIFSVATVGGTLLVRAEEKEAERKFMERLKKDYKVVSVVLDENSILLTKLIFYSII